MDFRKITIPYQGRAKYGVAADGDAIARSIIKNYFGEGSSAGGGGNNSGGGENRGDNSTSFFAYLDKTSGSFSDVQVAEGVYEHIRVFGFKAMDTAQVLIGDLNNSGATDYCDIELYSNGTQIILPYSGFTMLVSNNGTTYPTIDIHLDNNFPIDTITKGELRIPINVNINGNDLDPYHQVWYANKSWVQSAKLYYTFEIVKGGDSSYVLDLSNEKAQVNCDSAGTMFSASIMTITCQARTTLNGDEVSEARYSLVRPLRFNAQGVDINSVTGEMVFNYSGSSYFSFNGDTLPIDIKSELDGRLLGMKTMTIYKNMPGADGSPAVSHWINTSVNQVNYNPNTDTYVPTQVSAVTWRQVGYNEPEIDSATTMWYGWDDRYMTEYPAGSLVSVSGRGSSEVLYFGLKNANERFYEMETIPILSSGKDGASGATGASGAPGTNGVDGRSAWYMTLSNDNSSINCDASGNILTGAVRPDPCKVRMYYGDERRTDATYDVSANTPYTGITTATSNGQLTITAGQNLNFDGGLLEIIVSGTSSGAQRDVKTMTISKNYAGTDGASGQNAVSYWLVPNYTEVIWDRTKNECTPELITCETFKQEGGEAPSPNPSEAKIALQKQYREGGSWTPSNPSTGSSYLLPSTGLSINTAFCQTYRRVRLVLMVGSSQYDLEDIDILKDGIDGTSGEARRGAAIRGPYNYYAISASNQCWCAGESGSSCSDCENWIDIVYKDGTYYRCNHTYKQTFNYGLSRGYWTEGENYDFVATQVLLASAASINFLTNNWLYLMDEDGDITGGAKGGSGVTFWAGSEDPDMGNTPFRVYTDGTMVATKGTFGCFSIGKDENNNNALVGTETNDDGVEVQTFDAYINPRNLNFSGIYSGDGYTNQYSVRISPDENYQDSYGALVTANFDNVVSGKCGNISPDYVENIGFETNGNVRANKFKGNVKTPRISAGPQLGTAVMSLYPSEIVYTTSDATIFTKEGHWFVGGTIDTGISTAEDKSLFYKTGNTWYYDGRLLTRDGVCISGGTTGSVVSGAVEGMVQWHFNGMPLNMWVSSGSTSVPVPVTGQTNANKWKNGYWELPTGFIDDFQISGIGHPDYLTKRNNTIYIEV